MELSRTAQIGFHALRRNVTRSVLTVLGIVIGIASVIAMMELGAGSSKAIQQTISSMGANNLIIFPGTAASGGVSFGAGSVLTLTAEDSEAILKDAYGVRAVAPIVRARGQVVRGDRNWVPMNIYGTTPAYLNVRDWTAMTHGEMFSDRDVRNANKVCVIGQTILRELFPGENPIGQEIRIQNVSFKVIGVLSSKGANMMGMDQDDVIIAPWTSIKFRVSGTSGGATSAQPAAAATSSAGSTGGKIYSSAQVSLYPVPSAANEANQPVMRRFSNIDQIAVAANSSSEIQVAIQQITAILRERHRLSPSEPEDFNIRDMSEMTKVLTTTSSLMTKLLLSVALISLLVGGVGIMNIMLVSVTERTREIGLRMAVGAKGKDILQQFLVEAVVLCLAGGIIGILCGVSISGLVTLFLKWPTETSISSIIASVAVSASVGIGFGFYPAWKASQLDPINALRYE